MNTKNGIDDGGFNHWVVDEPKNRAKDTIKTFDLHRKSPSKRALSFISNACTVDSRWISHGESHADPIDHFVRRAEKNPYINSVYINETTGRVLTVVEEDSFEAHESVYDIEYDIHREFSDEELNFRTVDSEASIKRVTSDKTKKIY